MKKITQKITHESMNKRMDDFIQGLVKGAGDDDVAMSKIETATRVFMDSLTPLERGMLLYDDALPIEISQLGADDYDHYISKYGMENLEKGCFFRLSSGAISFISHEHNLKYKVRH